VKKRRRHGPFHMRSTAISPGGDGELRGGSSSSTTLVSLGVADKQARPRDAPLWESSALSRDSPASPSGFVPLLLLPLQQRTLCGWNY